MTVLTLVEDTIPSNSQTLKPSVQSQKSPFSSAIRSCRLLAFFSNLITQDLTSSLPFSQYTKEIENNGGVNVHTYGATCTHVIVHRVRDDDPVCLAAKKDKKTLVTDLWVADSLDMGALADPKKILYKPVRDLNGIPSCDSLCICLTGYQSQDRANIMKYRSIYSRWALRKRNGNLFSIPSNKRAEFNSFLDLLTAK